MAVLEIKGDFKDRVHNSLNEFNMFSSLLQSVFEELEALEEDIYLRSEELEINSAIKKLKDTITAMDAVRKITTKHLWVVGPYFKDNDHYKEKDFQVAYRLVEDLIDEICSQTNKCLDLLNITKDFML